MSVFTWIRSLTTQDRSHSRRRGSRRSSISNIDAMERRLVLSPTVGVYDENIVAANTVDFTATGSSMTVSEFAADVSTAFAENRGGVINGSILGGQYEFGAALSKQLLIGAAGSSSTWGIGSPSGGRAISGTGAFATTGLAGTSSYNSLTLEFRGITSSVPNEQVVQIGLTALSLTGRDYGIVTTTGNLASGGTVAASRRISEPNGQGDTFFGLAAPAGEYFTSFTLAYAGPIVPDLRLWFDDVGFITAVPEDTSNQPPTANDDTFETNEDLELIVNPGVLYNDNDPDEDSLEAIATSDPANGTLIFNLDGTFTYIPDPDFNGTDGFTYVVTDGEFVSDPATVTINVAAVNDRPTVNVPAEQTVEQTVGEDVSLLITDISVEDVDVNEGTGEVRVTLTVTSGSVSVADDVLSGLVSSQIIGNSTSHVVLEGAISAVNATLAAGVTYVGNIDFSGSDILSVTVDDLGNTGLGGPLTNSGTVAIQVRSVRDQIANLIAAIRQLERDRVLNKGQANSLIVKLQNAQSKLNLGQTKVALNMLDSFSNHVESFVADGVLTEEQGSELLDALASIRFGILRSL